MSAALHTRAEQCEWNPAEDRPCYPGEHDALAVFGVGSKWNKHLHLCPSCAGLPRFKRFKKEVLPGAVDPRHPRSPRMTPARSPIGPTGGVERTRFCYLGPVQRHRLETAVAPINEAFDSMSYLVGSCLMRPDYRDVDVRLILDDVDFARLFGADLDQAHGRATALWTSLAVTYSRDLSALTGLEVDFQIQAVTPANSKEPGERHALFVTRPMEAVR